MGNYKRGPGNYKSSYFRSFVLQEDVVVNNSTTLVNILEWSSIPLTASTSFGGSIIFFVDSSSVADIKVNITSSVAIFEWGTIPNNVNALLSKPIALATNGNVQIVHMDFRMINTASSAGSFNIQFAQNNLQVSDTKVLKGSSLMIMED